MSVSSIRRGLTLLCSNHKGVSFIPASSFIPKKLQLSSLTSSSSLNIDYQYPLGLSTRLFLSSATAAKNNSEAFPKQDGGNDKASEQTEKPSETSNIEKELKQELAKINEDLLNTKTKCQDFEDKYLRSLADSENLRTRLTRQISDQKLYAIQNFCKDLTDIEDVLNLAIKSVTQEQLKESKPLATLYEGLKMTEKQLLQVFERHGLTQLNPLNAKFNPNEHEAVLQKEEPGVESGTVILVSKVGYKLHERVIRPAIVGVAK